MVQVIIIRMKLDACLACIGDAMNDYDMLIEADVPVAMGNAISQIKVV